MTFLPLPNQATEIPQDDRNTGLWFERFFDQYGVSKEGKFSVLKTDKENPNRGIGVWLKKFKNAGNTTALQYAAYRQIELVKQLNGKHRFFNSQWHFVTGTGYPHPAENALLWHPVQGVPYLSGAAVKGLVRAWVEQWAGLEDQEKRQRLLIWFGSDDKDPKQQQHDTRAGDLIFFDALPVKAVSLVTDIMTPHYGDWYQKGDTIKDVAKDHEKIPADWHKPVPIPFLVVDKASSYLFSVAPRNAQAAERINLDEVMDSLVQALEWLGAGAKTATGYGQMVFNAKTHDTLDAELQQPYLQRAAELQKAQEEQDYASKMEGLSELEKEYFAQTRKENWANDRNALLDKKQLELWLDKLKNEPDKESTQNIVANLKELLNHHVAGLLVDPDKVKGKKKEPVYSSRLREIAHALNKL
jgi:CRISPR-associated protein Cmr6